ncbi:Dyp-type peroxidase [Kineococcus radiotolerans]|uniref:Dyp-type peroxidase n=1 Tax=Kineococcus radiotolerans TaxID=131568 RepID=UPI0016150A99
MFTSGAAALGGAGAGVLGSHVGARAAFAGDGGAGTSSARTEGRTEDEVGRAKVPFHGEHQAGVTTAPQAFATLIAFDLLPGLDRDGLIRLMRIWTDDITRLTAGQAGLADTEPELAAVPARLSVTLGYGPGVFTAAGLESARPSWLGPLPAFGIDRLRPEWCEGDLLLQVCADDQVSVAHAVRLLTKEARTFAAVRWVQHGFRRSVGSTPSGTTMRNLMGQVDGTRNVDPTTAAGGALVWIDPSTTSQTSGADPADGADWLVGGTSMIVRRIAIDLDTWDELDRSGREAAVGRRLHDGAPLTGAKEHDEPDLDATGDLGLPVIDTFAHIRRARTDDATQTFLRRAYNYDVAPPPGQLSDSGLVFISFQADLAHQFIPVQQRLDELDLLNQWTTPIGSAVFAMPRGCREGEYLGQSLLE